MKAWLMVAVCAAAVPLIGAADAASQRDKDCTRICEAGYKICSQRAGKSKTAKAKCMTNAGLCSAACKG